MVKQVIAQTYTRSAVGGRRYSRNPADVTAPTAPTYQGDPVPNATLIDLAWLNGIDAESGIKETLVEYRVHLATNWIEWSRIAYPGSDDRITGLAQGTAYDVAISSVDNAANTSARVVKTVSTLGTSADLSPGRVSFVVTSLTAVSGAPIVANVVQTGAGVNSPIVTVNWAFSGFTSGTPTPSNGVLTFPAGGNSTQVISATAGTVSVTTMGQLRIVSAQAASGSVPPSTGTTTVPVTVTPSGSVLLDFDAGFESPATFPATTGDHSNPLYNYNKDVNSALASSLTISTEHAREGTRSLKCVIIKDGLNSWREEARIKDPVEDTPAAGTRDYWLGEGIYISSLSSLVSERVMQQWHTHTRDTGSHSPIIGLRIINGNWLVTNEAGAGKVTWSWLNNQTIPVRTNEWTDWVYQIRWRTDLTGFCRIWMNGVLVLEKLNVQTLSTGDPYIPYYLAGCYLSSYRFNNADADGTRHQSYHDAIRISMAVGAAYSYVAPRGNRLTAP